MIVIAYCDYNFPKLIKNGVVGTIIGQYISDLIFNIFIYNKRDFYKVITEISPLPAYIAATSTGFINGITNPYIDDITSAGMRNIVYSYTNNYFSVQMGEIDAIDFIDMPNLTQDTVAVIILVWVFNIHAQDDFYRHKDKKRYGICEDESNGNDYDILSASIIIIAINLYAYYKLSRDHPEAITQVDRGIDFL